MDKIKITGHRPPTPYEIRFGEGATHYKAFDRELWQRFLIGNKVFPNLEEAKDHADKIYRRRGVILGIDARVKKWIKCPYDGLRYYR